MGLEGWNVEYPVTNMRFRSFWTPFTLAAALLVIPLAASAQESVEDIESGMDGGVHDGDGGIDDTDGIGLEGDGGPADTDGGVDPIAPVISGEPESGAEPEPEVESEEMPEPPCDLEPRTRCGHTPRPAPTPVNFRVTETFISEYVGDNGSANEALYGDDDDYWIFRNLLYLQAGNKYFDSAMRLDLTLFQNPPARVEPDGFVWGTGASGYTTLNYGNDFRVERIHGTAHIGNLHVTGGDFYVNFGRGIALSLIKLDDVGVDNAIRGGRIEYRMPRKFKIILVGGVVNSLNIDPITHQLQEDDPLDKIVGARAEWEIGDALCLGAHGVLMKPRFEQESDIDPDRIYVDQGTGVSVLTGGASAEIHLGGAHIYLEGDGQSHDNYRPTGRNPDVHDESGYGVFMEASYDLTPFMLKGEGILYRRWLMEGPYRGSSVNAVEQPIVYHHMVTLEPVWMIIKSFGNAEGGRLTGDLYLKGSDTQLTLTNSFIKYEGGLLPSGVWDDHPPTFIVHPILKARQTFGGTGIGLVLEGGFRYETTDEPPQDHPDDGTLWHLLSDLSVPISGPHSVELKLELRRHELEVTEGMSYWVIMESLGYEMSGLFGITFVHEYSDQTPGEDSKIGNWTMPMPHQHYMWALLSVHAPDPLDGLTLRLFAGSQRGGIKCAGGVCRLYPDSVGVKIEAVYRF